MAMQDLQIDWLKAFVAAVDAGTLSGAARQVHRSQSAVSMQIKKLENVIGKPVLERNARSLTLTPTGKDLIGYARKMLEIQSQALELTRGEEVRGRIHLGVPDDYANAYLAPVLRSFAIRHPSAEITLTCEHSGALIPKVEAGEIDIALVTRDKVTRGELLFLEEVYWVAAEEYKVWEKDPLPLATHEESSHIRETVLARLESQNTPYRIVYQSPSTSGQVAVALSGIAVAVLTKCSLTPKLKVLGSQNGLPQLPTMEVELVRSKKSKSSTAVDAMYEEIIHALKREV